MKIICDCGNEVNLVEPNDNEDRDITDEGLYVVPEDHSKFDFWEQHDVVGMVCRECGRAIWMFV